MPPPTPPARAPGAAAPPAGPVTRPASLWPEAGGSYESALGQEAITHFDPLPEAAQQLQQRQRERLRLCEPATALRVLLAVQLVLALAALPVAHSWRGWWLLLPVPLCAGLAGGLSWLSAVCALRHWLPAWPARLAAVLVAGLGALAALLGWGLTVLLGVAQPQAWGALAAAVPGAALAAGLWAWAALRAAAARPVEAHARLAELQSRIRPHFLFNALNTALALVQVDPPRAETVLEDLSQLFRAALAETGSAVSLDDEVDLAQRYLAIEQIRFGHRLRVSWDLDPSASEARLPPLVLQPLVENAVRHGIEPAAAGGTVRVRTRLYRGMVSIEVHNSLPAADEAAPTPGHGLALANVRERLRLLHDLAGRLHTSQDAQGYTARIEVPL